MSSFRPQYSNFIKPEGNISQKEEALYRNTLPAVSFKNEQFNPIREDKYQNTGCVVQETMHNCQILQPAVNFFQLEESQKKLNEEWNDVNMNKRYKNLQKQRDTDDEIIQFNPIPAFDMMPVSTTCYKQNLVDTSRMYENQTNIKYNTNKNF